MNVSQIHTFLRSEALLQLILVGLTTHTTAMEIPYVITKNLIEQASNLGNWQ